MEEGQIKKILKNLDTSNEHQSVLYDDSTDCTTLSECCNAIESGVDVVEENVRLKHELETQQMITHLLSEMYLNKGHFLCDIGYDDIPSSIVNNNGEVLVVIPNTSSDNILLCLYLCAFLNNAYNNIEDEVMSDFYSIQGLLLDMGV